MPSPKPSQTEQGYQPVVSAVSLPLGGRGHQPDGERGPVCACGNPVFIKKSGECKTCYFRRKGREHYARVGRVEGRHECPTCGSTARGIEL